MAGPHEILGMSRVLGISTTEFLALYSDHDGTTLRAEEDDSCVFLTPAGCRVHPRRPLVCRLYPLGRTIDEAGEELFGLFPRQSDCEAEFSQGGTVGSFLESQGVGPYLDWSRRYGELYRRMIGLIGRLDAEGEPDALAEAGAASLEEGRDRVNLSSWQDIDASLSEYCAANGLTQPREIDESIALHIRAMEKWLDDLESRFGPGALTRFEES